MMTNLTFAEFYSTKIDHLTLAECLDIHYYLNPHFTKWHKYHSPLARRIIKAHDITHIIFACDTSLLGELQVQSWSSFGVKKNLLEAPKYLKDKEATSLLNPVGFSNLVWFILTHLDEVFKVWQQSRKLSKKWVYFDEDRYMATKIGNIRAEYNIMIAGL